jgi:hypothetical protein
VLDALVEVIRRYLALPDGAAEALALWIVHTYMFEHWAHTPRLLITSPGPGMGKTVLMTLLRHLCTRGDYFSSATEAAILRYMDEHDAEPHTLLFDEADTFFLGKSQLKNVINASFERGRALLSVPTANGGWKTEVLSARAPIGIAGIGSNWIWPALRDRSVEIKMRKKLPTEHVEKFGVENEQALKAMGQLIANWVKQNADALRTAQVEMPPGVGNRDADKWRPLITIGTIAGGRWLKLAKETCQKFVGSQPAKSSGGALVSACASVFSTGPHDQMFTDDLIKGLNAMPDQPWTKGSPLDVISLARLLRPYDITPSRLSIDGVQRRGYRRTQFEGQHGAAETDK